MGDRIRLKVLLLLTVAVLLLWCSPAPPTSVAHAASQSISVISISPIRPDHLYQVGDNYWVSVNVSIAAGEAINGFDVRVNYTNPLKALRASTIDYSSNLFSPYQNDVAAECIDGISKLANAAVCAPENLGQVHLVQAVLGRIISGPISGSLFRIGFQVQGNGTSMLSIDRSDLNNPNPDPSNPNFFYPQLIPLLRQAAIFGNQGLVAFFNFQPSDTSLTPSIIPNNDVVFDASASYVANNISASLNLFTWNFGDRMSSQNGMVVSHRFSTAGNYSVQLSVWDYKGDKGNLTRQVSVLPALGALSLTVNDVRGTSLRGSVLVRLFNSSSSVVFASQITNQAGSVRFTQLAPSDHYYATFSGPGLENASRTEKVIPGWTTMDTVYLSMTPPPQDISGLIYLGTILGGLGVVSAAIVYQKRRSTARRKLRVRTSIKAGRGNASKGPH